MYTITIIPGDGVGPELTEIVMKVIDSLGVKIKWDVQHAGESALAKYGTPLPDETLNSISRNKVALKAPLTTPIGKGFRSVNVSIRKKLDLYSCLRPCRIFPGTKSTKYTDVDLVIVRENTEDLYAGVEFAANDPDAKYIIDHCNNIIKNPKGKPKFDMSKLIDEESAVSIKLISRKASERIVKFAFDYAVKYNRKKVTAIAKANIMKCTDGLFYESARDIAKQYPNIGYEERLVDNMCMQLVQKPQIYDVLVLPNLYGDILSDLCAGLIGGLGVAPGANIGDDMVMFEAVHGSAPKYTGMNKVNPIALLMSAKLMLEHIGETTAAAKLENGIAKVVAVGKVLTYDLGGTATSTAVGDEIINSL
jgi:isocitrate dehydrogenase (NAD+)